MAGHSHIMVHDPHAAKPGFPSRPWYDLAKPLLGLAVVAITVGVIGTAQPTHASPEGGQLEELRERIVRLCNEAWGPEPAREQQCRDDNVRMLEDYIQLINSYPPTSDHYRVLIECSQRWPEAIAMWKMCANLEMPNEPAFKPFDTGPSPVEVLRQYQQASPSPLAQPDPRLVPENLRNLPNPMLPSAGTASSIVVTPQVQGQQPVRQQAIQQPQPTQQVIQRPAASALTAPQPRSTLAPPPSGTPSGGVYVPGAGVRQ